MLVTRPAKQAGNLCDLISAAGGLPIRFPTLDIAENCPEPQVLLEACTSDWLIFTSSNAVDFALKAFNGKMPGWTGRMPKVAVVGAATAKSLMLAGWQVDCLPASEFNSEGLLAETALQQVAGKTCVIIRGVGGRETIAETLRTRGARIVYLEVYRRSLPDVDSEELLGCLRERQLAALTVTSGEALQNLLQMLDKHASGLLWEIPLIVGSARIGQLAGQLGFKRIAVSRQPTDTAILETLMTFLNGENSGRTN